MTDIRTHKNPVKGKKNIGEDISDSLPPGQSLPVPIDKAEMVEGKKY